MTDSTTATELFNSLRGRLFGLAYRMTGSRADARTSSRRLTSAGTAPTTTGSRARKPGW